MVQYISISKHKRCQVAAKRFKLYAKHSKGVYKKLTFKTTGKFNKKKV